MIVLSGSELLTGNMLTQSLVRPPPRSTGAALPSTPGRPLLTSVLTAVLTAPPCRCAAADDVGARCGREPGAGAQRGREPGRL